MAIQLIHFPSLEELTLATVNLLAGHIQQTVEHPFAIMLSGGKTPLAIYHRLAHTGVRSSRQLHLLWSDERMVPKDSPESNSGNTQELISALGIPPSQLVSVKTDLPLEHAASDYHRQIQSFLDRGGLLPLGLLGLGPDGHTASLFNIEDASQRTHHWAIAVPRPTPPDRVSVTAELLSRFERLLLLVTGPEKKEILNKFEKEPDTIPAGVAVRGGARVEVWCCLGQG